MHLSATILVPAWGLLVGLLVFEKLGSNGGKLVTKIPLSALFVLAAVVQPHQNPVYYRLMLTGLVFCLVGDVCLIFDRRSFFLAGLAAFLGGHLWYTAAFYVTAGLNLWTAIGVVAVLINGFIVFRWLRPHLDPGMKGPVTAYIVVISLMLTAAGSLLGENSVLPRLRIMVTVGALAFYISDIFVARNRFIKMAFLNRLLGLPLYYTGQFLLAFSVASSG